MSQTDAAQRFLALGDSYTIGEGVAADERWPLQLARALRARGIAIGDPQIIATTGWTTDELAAAMDAATFTPPYALVTLLIGVNNQYRGRSIENYREEFAGLLGRAIDLAGGDAARVIIVSIPDWGVTRFARDGGRDAAEIARDIDAFNAAARVIGERQRVVFINVTDASRDAGDHHDMLVADGLHPSTLQYAKWSELVMPAAIRALASQAQHQA
jgi:lysophospholipase L1-like esterase